jgi:hypothetical protein
VKNRSLSNFERAALPVMLPDDAVDFGQSLPTIRAYILKILANLSEFEKLVIFGRSP